MKKVLFLMAAIMLSASAANAQSQLGNLLGKAASAISNGSSNGLVQGITNVISSKLVPTTDQIVGTWLYQKPAVMFTSSNALKSLAGSATSATIENKLQTYLSKVGLNKGKMNMTFNADKTFTINRNGKKITSGTYEMNGNDVNLFFKNKTTPCKVTPQLDNGTLVIVMDATKLKTFMEGIGSSVQQLSTVTSLLKNIDGIKLGLRLSK